MPPVKPCCMTTIGVLASKCDQSVGAKSRPLFGANEQPMIRNEAQCSQSVPIGGSEEFAVIEDLLAHRGAYGGWIYGLEVATIKLLEYAVRPMGH